MKLRSNIWVGFLVFIMALFLTACGGGGGGASDPPAPDPAKGSKWDQMEWDQGKWG